MLGTESMDDLGHLRVHAEKARLGGHLYVRVDVASAIINNLLTLRALGSSSMA